MTRDEAINKAWWDHVYAANKIRNEAEDEDAIEDFTGRVWSAFHASLAASGYAVVPVEATGTMIEAGSEAFYSPDCERTAIEDIRLMWSAMLSAALKEDGNE